MCIRDSPILSPVPSAERVCMRWAREELIYSEGFRYNPLYTGKGRSGYSHANAGAQQFPTLDAPESKSESSAADSPDPTRLRRTEREGIVMFPRDSRYSGNQTAIHSYNLACRALSLPYNRCLPSRLGRRPAAEREQQGPWEGGSSVSMGSALNGHATIPIARSGRS